LNYGTALSRVLREVDRQREEIVGFLRELLRIPSVTGNERDIQNFISSKLREWGIRYDMWEIDEEALLSHPLAEKPSISYRGRPMLVGIVRGAGGGRSLVFNGHVDTVPAGDRASWTHDPFGGEVVGDLVYGRGASDMKAGVAAYTMAVKAVLDAGITPKGDVFMHYVVDEENTSNGTLAAVLRGYVGDGAVNAEASNLEVQPAVSGSMWFSIYVRGRSASMSRPHLAVNAIEQAFKVYEAVKRLYEIRVRERRHPLYPDVRGVLSLFIGMVTSGHTPSVIPDRAVLRGRMGLLPGETIESAISELRDYILRFAELDPWLRYNPPEVRQEGYAAEGAETPVEHPLVQALIQSYKDSLGREPVVKGHEGASDMRLLVKVGVPTVCFGPGLIEQMHAAVDEHVRASYLINSVKVMSALILRWCGFEA